MADAETDRKELEALTAALNRSAERVQTLWLSFIVFMLYLAIAAGTTTHRMLFRGDPLKLPVLNIDLPLLGFYFLAPLLLVVFQFYLLLNLNLLARTANAFETTVAKVFPEAPEQGRAPAQSLLVALFRLVAGKPTLVDGAQQAEAFRMRIENTMFAQLLAGAAPEREGRNAKLLSLMSFLTVALAPAAALLLIERQFLPYHHGFLTWWHRGLLLVSLGLALALWPAYRRGGGERWGPASAAGWGLGLSAGALAMAYALLVANYPGEWLYRWTAPVRAELRIYEASYRFKHADEIKDKADAVERPELPTEEEAQKKAQWAEQWRIRLRGVWRASAPWLAMAWPASALSLRNVDLIDDSRRKQIADRRNSGGASAGPAGTADAKTAAGDARWIESVNLRDRDLVAADLTNADVEQAEFSGADLSRALMARTWSPKAHFGGSDLGPSRLVGASLDQAQLQGASLDQAQLQGASLGGAQLQGASLDRALVWRADVRSAANAEKAWIGAPDVNTSFGCARWDIPRATPKCVEHDGAYDAVMKTLESLPDNQIKAQAQDRLKKAFAVFDEAVVDGEPEMAATWTLLSTPPLPLETLLADWPEIACRPNAGLYAGAPYAARGLLGQLESTQFTSAPAAAKGAFAAPLLNEAKCPGVKSLTAAEKAKLQAYVDAAKAPATARPSP